jgi:hypothetical protein
MVSLNVSVISEFTRTTVAGRKPQRTLNKGVGSRERYEHVFRKLVTWPIESRRRARASPEAVNDMLYAAISL